MSTTPPSDEAGADLFIESIMRGNARWMSRYRGSPAVNGSAKAVVLTCMDSRIPPLEMLGLEPGEVFIIRNAGNAVTPDSLRSLLICLTVMECRKVLVVGHSRCGMRSSGDLDERVSEAVDQRALESYLGAEIGDLSRWLGFHDRSEEDWAISQAGELGRLLPRVMPGRKVRVYAALYDLDNGRLEMLLPSVPEQEDDDVAHDQHEK